MIGIWGDNMGKITMLLNARQIVNVHNNTKLILMAFETVVIKEN